MYDLDYNSGDGHFAFRDTLVNLSISPLLRYAKNLLLKFMLLQLSGIIQRNVSHPNLVPILQLREKLTSALPMRNPSSRFHLLFRVRIYSQLTINFCAMLSLAARDLSRQLMLGALNPDSVRTNSLATS